MGCRRCIETGTCTGYTALTIALPLPEDGHLIVCDITDQYVRQDIWKKARVDEKITLKVGPALDTFKQLLDEYGHESFDFIFIDADKVNYLSYYQIAMELVRSNGLIAIDNTLWSGQVIDQTDTSENTNAIQQINDFLQNDQRIDISFSHHGDGTTLWRKI